MAATDVSEPALTTAPAPVHRQRLAAGAGVVAVALTAAVIGALALPDLPGTTAGSMTHYMELLATNQPWNLLMFMAVPVVLAETVAITELMILVNRATGAGVRMFNRWAGLIGGLYFVGVFGYLLVHAVIPLSADGGWRGPADVIAVGAYLAGVVPLFGIALLELGVIGGDRDRAGWLRLHAALVGAFLVVAHIAMIVGMLDPTVLGWGSGASHGGGHGGMPM